MWQLLKSFHGIHTLCTSSKKLRGLLDIEHSRKSDLTARRNFIHLLFFHSSTTVALGGIHRRKLILTSLREFSALLLCSIGKMISGHYRHGSPTQVAQPEEQKASPQATSLLQNPTWSLHYWFLLLPKSPTQMHFTQELLSCFFFKTNVRTLHHKNSFKLAIIDHWNR